MTIAQIIGDRLANLREVHSLTQDEIQQITGINRTTYSKNESGKAAPSLTNLRILAKLYGVSLDYLCNIRTETKNVFFDSSKNITQEERMLIYYYRLLEDNEKTQYFDSLCKMAEKSISQLAGSDSEEEE